MTAKAYDAAKTEAKIDQLQSDLAAEKRAREEATEDTRSLCRFILSEWGPDGALKATTYSLEQREARSAKGGDANDSGPSRPIDATSPGVTAGASAGEDGELCKRVDDTLQAMASQALARAESSEALVAELREKVERLRKALEPFAEAATKGEIGSYPPNYFVGATEFENARRACTALEGRDNG